MKKEIHPKYFPNAVIHCACGNEIKTGSTKEKTDVEICSACHPFFTGKKKLIDTAGRVEKFKARLAGKQTKPIGHAKKSIGQKKEAIRQTNEEKPAKKS